MYETLRGESFDEIAGWKQTDFSQIRTHVLLMVM